MQKKFNKFWPISLGYSTLQEIYMDFISANPKVLHMAGFVSIQTFKNLLCLRGHNDSSKMSMQYNTQKKPKRKDEENCCGSQKMCWTQT